MKSCEPGGTAASGGAGRPASMAVLRHNGRSGSAFSIQVSQLLTSLPGHQSPVLLPLGTKSEAPAPTHWAEHKAIWCSPEVHRERPGRMYRLYVYKSKLLYTRTRGDTSPRHKQQLEVEKEAMGTALGCQEYFKTDGQNIHIKNHSTQLPPFFFLSFLLKY